MQPTKFLAAAALLCGLTYAQSPAPGLAGDWEGTLDTGAGKLRLALHITRGSDGLYIGKGVSLDQGNAEFPLGKAAVEGRSFTLEFPIVSGVYKGELSEDGSKMTGTWSQGTPLPLDFTRTGKAPAAEPPKTAATNMPSPFGPLLDVTVPAPPIPFRGAGGQSQLIYELYITNLASTDQLLTKIEVSGDSGPLASFEGSELTELLKPVIKSDDPRKIGPGLRLIAFLSVPLRDKPAPPKLSHRLTLNSAAVDIAPVALRAPAPIVIGPPLRGADWLAANGPNNRSIHRLALIPIQGRLAIAQRFAIDWVQLKTADATFTGDPKDNKNYAAYGADVLAVADATVVATKDGIPENVPGLTSRAAPITLETVAGNHIILDLGGGNYCMYAHLQPGSLKVKVGDKVKRGQVLGLLGNSGNSTEPHLHFQVMDGTSPLGSEGLPYHIDAFELLSGNNTGKKDHALPMQNMKIRF
jgi:murein DD-endopeptidase MepM/ murein hydrolase activator NlpD